MNNETQQLIFEHQQALRELRDAVNRVVVSHQKLADTLQNVRPYTMAHLNLLQRPDLLDLAKQQ